MDKRELEKIFTQLKNNMEINNKNECLSFIQNFIVDNKNELPGYVIDQLITLYGLILTNKKETANEKIKELIYIVESDNG